MPTQEDTRFAGQSEYVCAKDEDGSASGEDASGTGGKGEMSGGEAAGNDAQREGDERRETGGGDASRGEVQYENAIADITKSDPHAAGDGVQQQVTKRRGGVPPKHRQFGQPGGNKPHPPIPSLGARMRQLYSVFSEYTGAELRRISADESESVARRAAAHHVLQLRPADLADYETIVDGSETLSAARSRGVATDAIKEVKPVISMGEDGTRVLVGREIKLRDEPRQWAEHLISHTDGTAAKRVEVSGVGAPALIQIVPSGEGVIDAELLEGGEVGALPAGEEG